MFDVGRWAFDVFLFPFQTPLCPARRHVGALRRVIVFARIRHAFIERHGDVASKRELNFHSDLGRNERTRSVDVILKFHAVFSDLA